MIFIHVMCGSLDPAMPGAQPDSLLLNPSVSAVGSRPFVLSACTGRGQPDALQADEVSAASICR